MKTAIVTFHNAFNYGATLQCAALSKILSKHGIEVVVIDYLPEYVENKKSIYRYLKETKKNRNKLKAVAKGIAYLRFAKDVQKRNAAFNTFVKEHMNMTKTYSSPKELDENPPKAAVYICGSDQVWNRSITGNQFDDAFFLRFVKKGRKIAYAVSLGETKPSEYRDELIKLTDGYRFISVREEDMAKELGECISTDVSTVVDPTLLLEEAEYRSFEKPVEVTTDKYLLLYNVQNSDISTGLAEIISKKKRLKIIDISPNPFRKIKGSTKRISEGPGEFLTLIRNAEFIVTNSFHGTVFSLIYRKQFFTVPHRKRSGRIISLLEMAGLENRLIDSLYYDEHNTKIDYDEVWSRIHKASDVSKDLLMKAVMSK